MLAGASRAVRRWLYSGGCTPDCATGASARGCAAAGVRPSLALWPPRVAAVQVTLAVSRVNTTIPPDQARRRPGRPCPHPRRPRAGRPGWPPPCRPASGASSAAWSVCSSMARAGTAATGSGGVTGAARADAACGALFTQLGRCSRRREAWSIFFVSNFFKEQFGVSLNFESLLSTTHGLSPQRHSSSSFYSQPIRLSAQRHRFKFNFQHVKNQNCLGRVNAQGRAVRVGATLEEIHDMKMESWSMRVLSMCCDYFGPNMGPRGRVCAR